jgi:hypothetical protein
MKEPEYDFSPTDFPELDAINGLIKLADEYAERGNMKKYRELCAKVEKALANIKNSVIKQN